MATPSTTTTTTPVHYRPPFLSIAHRLSFVALGDLSLSLSFLTSGLFPTTIDLDPNTSVHLWIPTHRNHRRSPLVLVHGFGGNSKWQWLRQIGSLSKSFDLYVPDLLFFGNSRSESSDRSIGFQARCVVEAVRRVGIGRYAVCGISYGGFVAYRMAEMAKEEVEKVVILTAGVCATKEQRTKMVEREKKDVFEVFLPRKEGDLMELMRRSMFRPPWWVPRFILRDFIEVMYNVHRKEREELLMELLTNGIGLDPLPVLTQRSLIIWGDHDNVFPPYLAHQLKSHLGQNSTLEIVKNAGHACQLENADTVNCLIQTFLLKSKCNTWQ